MPVVKPPSIAFAKTTRPVIASHVPRERLFARLDGSPGRRCAWISGPAGAGKTTLAASYVEARGQRALWYHVDADDADVATFLYYLRHAAQKLHGIKPADMPRFTQQQVSDVASFARKFFRQLFSKARGPFALVIDNLHAVPVDSALFTVLEAGFAQVPKGCCAIVTSRHEPPPSLARMRVTGELVTLGHEHLRLERDELAQVAALRGHVLVQEALIELHERTQGWAAGIVLMLEHARLSGRMAQIPGDATPSALFDYLAGEIFDRFETSTQQFLLKIACLSRMTAGVAEALSGEPKAARLLANLAHNDYFVKEVSSEAGRAYQFHPLLHEFLIDRASQDMPEALARPQLQKAALLLHAAGHTDDAVSLMIENQDWAQVAALVGEHSDAMLEQGRSETLAGWIDLLPSALLRTDPRLPYALGMCRCQVSPREARRHFEEAYEAYRRAGDERGMMLSVGGLIDATITEFDDLTCLDRWSSMLAALLAKEGLPRSEPARAALIRALLLRDPGNLALVQHLSTRAGSAASLGRAALALAHGDFATATPLLDELKGRTADDSEDPPAAAIGVATALCYLLRGMHERALGCVAEALARAESDGWHGHDRWLRAIGAAAALDAGDLDRARCELQSLEASPAMRRGDRAFLHYLRGWLLNREDDGAASLREAKSALALAAETGIPWLECLARLALAQLLVQSKDRRASDAQLRAAQTLAERLGSPLLRFCLQVAMATVALDAEDGAVLAPLAAAFSLGREHGFHDVPSWRPQALAELCALALRHGIEKEFAAATVRARRLVPCASALLVRDWPWPLRVRTLGRFQLLRGTTPVEFSGKGPGRPMELLKVLLALGGENVRADQLADALWPHVDSDYAHKSFTATLHRLRRLIGDDDALILRDARLSLNPALAWVDTWAVERLLGELDDALRALPEEAGEARLQPLTDELLALYRGPFLSDETEQPGYIACREQLRARLLRCLTRVVRRWEQGGRWEAAADCYFRCMEADPLFEAPYRNLMLLYQRNGHGVEARATYERLRMLLSARLKSLPSPETQAVFQELLGAGPS